MNAAKLLVAHNICNTSNMSNRIGFRAFTTSLTSKKSFKIQDEEDFNERVKKSKTPVIVDFFAT